MASSGLHSGTGDPDIASLIRKELIRWVTLSLVWAALLAAVWFAVSRARADGPTTSRAPVTAKTCGLFSSRGLTPADIVLLQSLLQPRTSADSGDLHNRLRELELLIRYQQQGGSTSAPGVQLHIHYQMGGNTAPSAAPSVQLLPIQASPQVQLPAYGQPQATLPSAGAPQYQLPPMGTPQFVPPASGAPQWSPGTGDPFGPGNARPQQPMDRVAQAGYYYYVRPPQVQQRQH